ncbi:MULTISPECIES: ABC transporter substrate-binding protein [Streptomyces]|uniref:ABC transporter substrate-binding protein n=1 Tax=Streptomyces TaxID=1883 RepID=UPI00163CBF0E|nr:MULTISPECIES: ABC transporter substrate-binding protein [Streptomyces]MBC2876265.1 ABC transporter substrate-binding protein [Streptomyces sp. TYQ1024]UBI35514.1 ABC transporter substrate-binding protein [Streptomyces mobaraensis]UKW28106.1 ABC transporter substrate-binding protein [Streptomyces sp. TYQ1024]
MTARSIRVTAAMVAAGTLATGAAACGKPGGGNGGNGSGGVRDSLVVGIANEPETLSPLLGYGKDGNSKIFDGLLRRDADMKLRPALAASLPKVTDDGRTYTFPLRHGVKFSDGKPFTAEDVVFTYRTILDEKTNNADKGELAAVDKVTARGDDTVVFSLKYPYAPFAERTVLPIVPEHAAKGQDVNTGPFNTKPVGTGPYVLTGWSKGEKLTFKANPEYWGGEPKVKKLTMAIIKDDDVRATRLRSGDLDGAILPPNLVKGFQGDDGKTTITAKTTDFRAVTLPTANKVTGDTAVRRALDLAVDRDAMVKSLLEGAGRAGYGPVPTNSDWFAKGTERPYDPEKAKKILDDAGWKPGGDGVREKDGVRAEFTLWFPAGDKLRQEHALAFASDAKKIGIRAKVQSGTWEVIQPRMKDDAVLAGGGNPADPDFDLYNLLHSSLALDGFNNMAAYKNPEVDKALEEGRRSGDKAVRKAAYDKIQHALADDPGYVFLTHVDHLYVMKDNWKDLTTQVEPHDHGLGAGPWWNVEDWQPKR